MRSEYSWIPPRDHSTVTGPGQIGVSFSAHPRLVFESGGHADYLTVPAGAVFATGPGEVCWSEVAEPTDALEIYPDLDTLGQLVDRPGSGRIEIRPVTAGHDATVLGTSAVLRRVHLGRLDVDDMTASAIAHRLLVHVAVYYLRSGRILHTPPGRLSRAIADRLAGVIEDRLGERLTLDDLAAEAGLSTYHFARAFKQTTGLAPHEFVTMRRVERGKALLLTSRHSVAEIAHNVGYHNVGHFRRMLVRHTGFRPADLRADSNRDRDPDHAR